VVPSRSPGSLEERDFCLVEKWTGEDREKPDRLDETMKIRSQVAEAPMVSDSVRQVTPAVRDRAVVDAGWESVAAARPGLLALLLS
jgi:hypothetical protein